MIVASKRPNSSRDHCVAQRQILHKLKQQLAQSCESRSVVPVIMAMSVIVAMPVIMAMSVIVAMPVIMAMSVP